MIITKAPLRVTLGGGGTDFPSYYLDYGGMCLAAAIDKYVYITLHETFVSDFIVKYSETERVTDASQVKHPLVRSAFELVGLDGKGLEICSHADIPSGTGLGSSSSFTVALLAALHAYKREVVHPQTLAEEACRIELEMCQEPIGKQDQYSAAYGGVNQIQFESDGCVSVSRLNLTSAQLITLAENLTLFFTGYTRSAANALTGESRTPEALHHVFELAYEARQALLDGDMLMFAHTLNRQWEAKRKRQPNAVDIEEWYTAGLAAGAWGGKLVGAGGGGFLMFYAENNSRLRTGMRKTGLQELPFHFDYEGARVVVYS